MHARVARGELGRILSVSGSYTQDWLLLIDDYNWRVEPDGHTNLRAVSDIGTHWMDLAQFITGLHIEQVNADLATFHPERKKPIGGAETFSGPGGKKATETVKIVTEDYGAVLLHLNGGARGVFHVMQMHAGRKNRLYLEVCGTEGSMVWDSESPELPLDGPPRRAQLAHEPRPVAALARGRRDQPLPRRSRRGLPRRLQAARPGVLQLHRLGLHRHSPASRPSPTATARSASARPSPRAPASGSGSA